VAKVGIHDDRDTGTGERGSCQHITCETALSVADDEADVGYGLPLSYPLNRTVGRTAVGD
jgi:hypothetical protein